MLWLTGSKSWLQQQQYICRIRGVTAENSLAPYVLQSAHLTITFGCVLAVSHTTLPRTSAAHQNAKTASKIPSIQENIEYGTTNTRQGRIKQSLGSMDVNHRLLSVCFPMKSIRLPPAFMQHHPSQALLMTDFVLEPLSTMADK